MGKDKVPLEPEEPQQSEEQQEASQRRKLAQEVKDLFRQSGWEFRNRVFNDLLEAQGRSLEESVDGFELYRAQGGRRALLKLNNALVEASQYKEEKEDEEKDTV